MPSSAPRVRDVLRRFWPYAAPRRWWMVAGLVLAAVSPALASVEIWLFKVVVDDVLIPRDFGLFPVVAATYVGLTVVQALCDGADRLLSTWLSQRFVVDVRTALLDHLQRLPLDFLHRSRLGDVMSRVTGDVSAVEAFLVSGSSGAVSSLLQLVFFSVALVVLQPVLALVALVVAPLFWGTSRFFARRLKDISRERQRRSGRLSTSLEQTLSTLPLVQAYDQGEREVARYAAEAEGKYRTEMAAARLRSFYVPTLDLIELLGALVVIGTGAWLLAEDELTVGGLLAFLTFLTRLYDPVRGLGSAVTSAFTASAGAERVIELLDEPTLPPDRPGAVVLDDRNGDLDFDDVSFTYPGADGPAVRGVSFSARPGDVVAIVGASGAGKSTLAGLLMRSLDPDAGVVRMGGRDLRDLQRASVRRHVAVVLQETLLVDGSVLDNIAFGRPTATRAEVEQAAREADAHDFIEAMPEGYDTPVGERGRRLSGGQAQRVAIARALLRDAPILLLDEPTTGLDALSARRVTEPLHRLMKGRTTVVVSHALAHVRSATLILVMDRGEVVERGTHEELLARDGHYAALWRTHAPRREPVGVA
ncbi:ABC transporter ATP-binding protein [Nocardioides hwasunensis]|uniref:ABC transporter ATP-binding protein n=1 Tax=Nocardioides hwasunensis TaxID=397258 RepID=A0ABR8MI28_9ACTN|nr:ABC transporter ATP-binding protein [Nocardioides hwasunensis]MBD3914911.1 ABC transporter ATP-binding protein [Nocardioides hwasunensis]